jgi:LmbE family N-acetylglucosaminyl deacetylase
MRDRNILNRYPAQSGGAGGVRERAVAASPFAGRHVLLIVAHQDDEVLGAGAQFRSFGQLSLLHVTDGAGFMREARAKGFASLHAYAMAREREMRGAVRAAGIQATFHTLDVRCLEASFHLPAIAHHLQRAIAAIAPDIILTHAYEGGHPDHDAVALAVHLANRRVPEPKPVWEFTGYHRAGADTVRGVFLRNGEPPLCLVLSEANRSLKRQMLELFRSQLDVVAQFPLDAELFRPVPDYDFTNPPHPLPLGYELEGWGMPAALWLAAARETMKTNPSWRARARLRWEMWTRRFHPDSPRVIRLMRAMPLLGCHTW